MSKMTKQYFKIFQGICDRLNASNTCKETGKLCAYEDCPENKKKERKG